MHPAHPVGSRARLTRLAWSCLVACALAAGAARGALAQPGSPRAERGGFGASLGAAAGHSDANENAPSGLQLYAHASLWRNLSARHSLGVEYGTLGGRDVQRAITFYSQSGPVLLTERDDRRTRDRIDRLAAEFRWRYPGDHGGGTPFTIVGAGYYFDRMKLDDVVSVPSDPSIPAQRFSSRRTSRWFGVLLGEGVTWPTGPVATGAFGRAEWAFSPHRLWVSAGLAVAWN